MTARDSTLGSATRIIQFAFNLDLINIMIFFTAHQRRCSKVMFSVVPVCLDTSVGKRAVGIRLKCLLVSNIIHPSHPQDPPFVFRNASQFCRGNACFYGYSIDLLARVAADLGFRYTLYEVADGRYGSLNEYTRQWDGMVNELIPGKNGLAVSSLNPERILRHPVGTS